MDRDEDELNLLFAVIPDTVDGQDYVRLGERLALDGLLHEWGLLDATALGDILNNFDTSADIGTTFDSGADTLSTEEVTFQ